jgi:hypothetical protein
VSPFLGDSSVREVSQSRNLFVERMSAIQTNVTACKT